MSVLTFRKVDSVEPVATFVATKIREQLDSGKQVLWLLSGGSAMEVAVATCKQLQGIHLGNLSVSLIDERYGPVGHDNSNWTQLQKAGLALPGATMVPILHGDDLEVTARKFDVMLESLFNKTDYHLALLGIGEDHHTAGILPGTEAVTAPGLICGYATPKFTRVTATAQAFAKLHEAVVLVLGEAKRPVLDALQKDLPPTEYPSQLLKQIPVVTIFNDQMGDA